MFSKDDVLEIVEIIIMNELDRDDAFKLVEENFKFVNKMPEYDEVVNEVFGSDSNISNHESVRHCYDFIVKQLNTL